MSITNHSAFGESATEIGANAAFEVKPADQTSSLSVCPTASPAILGMSGLTTLSIPVGVGLGATFPLTADRKMFILPYVVPGLYYERATNFGFQGGANVLFNKKYFAGLQLRDVENHDGAEFGIVGGLTF